MSYDVDVRHNYGKQDMKTEAKEYWIIETHPFCIASHRMIVEMSAEQAIEVKHSNPDLNIRLAEDEDYEDESIEHPMMNWEVLATQELSKLKLAGEIWLPGVMDVQPQR